jgi:hypothetical protein
VPGENFCAVRAEHFDQPQNSSPDFTALNLTLSGVSFCAIRAELFAHTILKPSSAKPSFQ